VTDLPDHHADGPAPQRRRWAITRPHPDWNAMADRAERARWRERPRPLGARRPRVRLWVPLTPILLLLSPLLLLVAGIAVFLPRPLGVNPIHFILGVGRMLLALNGTHVEVESPHASVLIKIL
jgi:hypothetical protein